MSLNYVAGFDQFLAPNNTGNTKLSACGYWFLDTDSFLILIYEIITGQKVHLSGKKCMEERRDKKTCRYCESMKNPTQMVSADYYAQHWAPGL